VKEMDKHQYYRRKACNVKYPAEKKEKSKGKLPRESQLKKNNRWLFQAEIFD